VSAKIVNEGFVWWHATKNRAELIGKLLIGATLLTASANLPPTRSSGTERVPLTSPTRTSWNDARREAKRLLGLELEVLNMENELTAALLHGDFAALRRIYADNYVSVNPEGILSEKASALREFESGEIKFISIHTDGVAVHVHENAAVVTGRADVHLRFGGEESREHLKFMHVYIKRDRRWLLVAQQLTRIARPL